MNRLWTVASVAALGLTVAACGGNANDGANMASADNMGMISNEAVMSDDMTMNGTMMDNGSAMAPAGTMTGKDFADGAAKSDAFEIAAAKLAQANAQSAQVKDFAAQMIRDHNSSTAKIKAAAAQASPAITPDPTLTAEEQTQLDALKAQTGASFDRAYATNQVAAHEKALAMLQSYAANGDVPSLKSAAGEIAPVVQGHLDMARKLPM